MSATPLSPRRIEIGIGLQSDKTTAEYAELAKLAERGGVDVITVYGDLFYQPPIFPLLDMARVTSTARLGAACWNPYTQHPYEIAGQLAALHQVSGGRGYLGLARGAWLDDIGVRQRRPVAHLREAVRVVRALLEGDTDGVDGHVFRLAAGARLRYAVPEVPIRVLIGTWGPATAALAGEVADELKVGGTTNPAMVRLMADRAAPGLRRAGRPDDALGIVVGAVTVVDEDGAAARAKARTEVAMYLAVVGDLDPTAAVPPDLRDRIGALVSAGRNREAGALIPDDILDKFAFSGTPTQVAAQAQLLIDAGAFRVEFGTPHGLTDEAGVDLLVRSVLPMLDLDR